MGKAIERLIVGCLVLFLSPFVFTANTYSRIDVLGDPRFIAGPTLLYPVTKDITLAGKDSLEFKWMRTNLAKTRHYEFKIYKGYNMFAADLIFKQEIPVGTYPVEIPVSLFEEGQVYTWSLRQVFLGGGKSDRSFSSFKIIKK
jgi:hypothetical protein